MSFSSLFYCEPPTFQQKHLIFPGHLTIQQVYPVSLPTKTEVLTDEGLFVLFQLLLPTPPSEKTAGIYSLILSAPIKKNIK